MKEFGVEVVAGQMIRLDLIDPEPHDPLMPRFCRVIDLRTARMLAILLIKAIEKAETNEAMSKKGKCK